MWTYRIDDADNDEVAGIAAIMMADGRLSLPNIISNPTKASGTVYVLMDSTGVDWAWLPINTNRDHLLKWAERNSK